MRQQHKLILLTLMFVLAIVIIPEVHATQSANYFFKWTGVGRANSSNVSMTYVGTLNAILVQNQTIYARTAKGTTYLQNRTGNLPVSSYIVTIEMKWDGNAPNFDFGGCKANLTGTGFSTACRNTNQTWGTISPDLSGGAGLTTVDIYNPTNTGILAGFKDNKYYNLTFIVNDSIAKMTFYNSSNIISGNRMGTFAYRGGANTNIRLSVFSTYLNNGGGSYWIRKICYMNGTGTFSGCFAAAADTTKPLVTDKYPRNATTYNVTNKITIAVNVTDETAMGAVKANITRPGAITTVTLKLSTTNRYNKTFTIPNVTGRYNVTFLANDSSGNKNWTVKTSFNVNDIGKPFVDNVRPITATTIKTGQRINISANVTDDVSLKTTSIRAIIIRPLLGAITKTLSAVSANLYRYLSFSGNRSGVYNVTFYANDTSNNQNASVKTSWTVNAVPSISLTTPTNNQKFYIPTSSSLSFTWNLIDKENNVVNTTLRFGSKNLNISRNILRGNYTFLWTNVTDALSGKVCNITAKDGIGNVNNTPNINLFTDQQPFNTSLRLTNSSTTQLFDNQSFLIVSDYNYTLKPTKAVNGACNITIRGVQKNMTLNTTSNLFYRKINATGGSATSAYSYVNISTSCTVVNGTIRTITKRLFIKDRHRPAFTLLTANNTQTNNNSIRFTMTVIDNSSVRANITIVNSSKVRLSNFSIVSNRTALVPLQANTIHFINITANDNASNKNSTKQIMIIQDSKAPKNTSSFTTYGCVIATSCDFFREKLTDNFENYTSFQNLNQVVQVNNVNYTLTSDTTISPYNYKASTQFASAQIYNLQYIYYQDRAGNTRQVPINLNVTVVQQGITPTGGGGGGSVIPTTTTTTSTSTLSTSIINFIAQYGTSPTDQQLLDLQSQLLGSGITLSTAELQTYIMAYSAVTPSSTISGGGGGGSGIAPVIVYNTAQGYAYVMATDPEGEGAAYNLLAEPGQKREKKIQIYNIGSKEVTIELKCDDTQTGNATYGFCKYVTLSETSFILPANPLQKKYISVVVNNPKTNGYGDKNYFQILSRDSFDNSGTIGFGITTSRAGAFFGLVDKAGETYSIPLNKIKTGATDAHVYKGVVAGAAGVGLAVAAGVVSVISFPVAVPGWILFVTIFSPVITSPIILHLIP